MKYLYPSKIYMMYSKILFISCNPYNIVKVLTPSSITVKCVVLYKIANAEHYGVHEKTQKIQERHKMYKSPSPIV